MSKDYTIILAVRIVLAYCYENGISLGSRENLWERAVRNGRKNRYDEKPKSLAAVIISGEDDFTPEEADELQNFYFNLISE